MGYVEKLLGTNEQILFRTRRHFFDIFGKLLKELLVLIVVIIGFVALDRSNRNSGTSDIESNRSLAEKKVQPLQSPHREDQQDCSGVTAAGLFTEGAL